MGGGNTGVEDRQRCARVTGRRRRRRRCTILITVRSEQFLNVILLHRPAKNRCTPVDYYYYAARLCRNLVGVIFPFSSPFFPFLLFFSLLLLSSTRNTLRVWDHHDPTAMRTSSRIVDSNLSIPCVSLARSLIN